MRLSDSKVLWEILQALTEIREPWLDDDSWKEVREGELNLRYYLGSSEYHIRQALVAAKKVEKNDE